MILKTREMWQPTKFQSTIRNVISDKHVDVYEEVTQQLWERYIGYYVLKNNKHEPVYEYWWRDVSMEEE